MEASQVRLLAGAAAIVAWGLLRGQLGRDLKKLRSGKRVLLLTVGVLFGPVLGVLFSLLAVRLTHLALAATLMSLTPVMMLPVMYLGYGERYRLAAVLGTVVAVIGAALLFWL